MCSLSVSQHYEVSFLVNPNILVGIVPTGMVILQTIDDLVVNEDRTLSLTLTDDFGSIPINITINETVVIIEDNDAVGRSCMLNIRTLGSRNRLRLGKITLELSAVSVVFLISQALCISTHDDCFVSNVFSKAQLILVPMKRPRLY